MPYLSIYKWSVEYLDFSKYHQVIGTCFPLQVIGPYESSVTSYRAVCLLHWVIGLYNTFHSGKYAIYQWNND